MTDDTDPLRARLCAADPARSVAPPPGTWITDLTEAVMAHDLETRPTPVRRRGWLVPAAAAAVLAVVGVGFLVLGPVLGPDDDSGPVAARSTAPTAAPTATPSTAGSPPAFLELSAGGAQAGRCLPVSAETLAGFPVAFEGTVEALDGQRATLQVTRWWTGGTPAQRAAGGVVVRGLSPQLQELVAGVDLQEGGRYLVTATAGGDVTACGFSAAYSPRLERLYATAFGG